MSGLTTYIPLNEILTWWPEHLFGDPGLGNIAITGYKLVQSAAHATAHIDLAVGSDIVISIVGIEGFDFVLPTTDLEIEAEYSGDFELRAGGFSAAIRITNQVLIPVDGFSPNWTPRLGGDGQPEPIELALDVGQIVVDADFSPYFEVNNELALSPFMIGNSGIVVEATGVQFYLTGKEIPPSGQPAGFRGISLEQVSLYLPASFDLPGITPDNILARGLVIGHGGVSGSFSGEWQTGWEGLAPVGNGAGTLLGIPFALKSLGIALMQNALTSASFSGEIGIPFFDAVVGAEVALDGEGGLAVALSQTDDDGLFELTIPFLGSFTLASLGFEVGEEGAALLLSGTLQLEVLSPLLQWPAIDLQELRISAGGEVQLPDGWIDLQEPVALDLFGFRLEITRIGFGNEDDGRRWVGFSGGVQLVDFLPTGASVEGLRIIWDPTGAREPELTLQGVGVELTLPGVLQFEGDVAFITEASERYFIGNAKLKLLPLGIELDAAVKIGRNLEEDYKYVYTFMSVTLPIGLPLWATGAALYGIAGLYGMNVNPSAQNRDWYGWYAGPPEQFNVTNAGKWAGLQDGKALGAGMTIGTLFDVGHVVSVKGLFALILPGPVIILQGKANFLNVPPDASDPSSQGVLDMLAVIDALAGTLQLNIDAGWSKAQVIEIAASAEAYFDFANPRNWHFYLGQDTPEDRRIRAYLLSLFHGDAYLMIDSDGIQTGAGISWGYDWKFGPVKVVMRAWIGGEAAITWQPPQLEGSLQVGGEFEISVAGFGVGLSAEAGLSGKAPSLYWVKGTLHVVVKLPTPIKDLDEKILLEWQEEAEPEFEDPFRSIGLEHPKVDETWINLPDSQIDNPGSESYQPGPLVPLDARPSLVFDRSMKDVTSGNSFISLDVYGGGTPIGDYTFDYELQEVLLEKWSKAGGKSWEAVDELYGTWMAVEDGDGEPAFSRLQLWAKSPFAFTRQTSRTYRDAFLLNHADWPCADLPEVTTYCVDWEEVELGTQYGQYFEYGNLHFTLVLADSAEVASYDVPDCGTNKALHIPGSYKILWIIFPEPVHTVEICLGGLFSAVRAYANGQLIEQQDNPGPGPVGFQTPGIDSLELWSLDDGMLARVCYQTEAETTEFVDTYEHLFSLVTGLQRWDSQDEILEPETWYRLTVRQETVRTHNGSSTRTPYTHYAYFQTGGPPGLVPTWTLEDAPPPNNSPDDSPAIPYPQGGKLADLKEYITWTIPGDGEQPVYRAYDLGAEFNENYVEQMYGADMIIHLLDGNDQPILDADGNEVQFPNQWADQPSAELSETEYPYTTRITDCEPSLEIYYQPDQKILFANGVLLEEDFSGDLEQWADPHPEDGGQWVIAAGRLTYDNAVIPVLGALLVAGDSEWSDYAVEVTLSDQGGDVGLACRYTNAESEAYYRLRLNAAGRYLEKVVGEEISVLWEDGVSYVPGANQQLAIQCQGTRLRGQLDGELLFDLQDETGLLTGAVGIFTNSTANFEHFLVRTWPGSALAPQTMYHAELLASFVLFSGGLTSGWTDSAYDWVELDRDHTRLAAIGRKSWDNYRVEVNAAAIGQHIGLLARFQQQPDGTFTCYRLLINPDDQIIRLARLSGTSDLNQLERVELWSCSGDACGIDFLLSTHTIALTCEGEDLIVEVDGVELTRQTDEDGLSTGKAGLYYVGSDDPDFSELVIRSAPRQPVFGWQFVTSRYAGFVEHLDTFQGLAYPEVVSGINLPQLADLVRTAEAGMSAASQVLDASRASLASAEPDEVTARRAETQNAAGDWNAEAAAHFEALYRVIFGGTYRPLPPVVEISDIVQGAHRLGLLLESPEPLNWTRLAFELKMLDPSTGAYLAVSDLLAVWSNDGARALFLPPAGTSLEPGEYELQLTSTLDLGLEAPLLRRSGSTLPEIAGLHFSFA
jgi:hypothetical protein